MAGDGELDAAEFVRLTRAAQQGAAAGDHPGAVELFDAALALWRGDALAEFGEADVIGVEAARLTALRLDAVEARADALLNLGRAGEVVGGVT
jgi:hypothetical protein